MNDQEQPTPDPCVNRVIAAHIARVDKGIKKYGTTLEDNPDSLVKRLRHFQEESMDASAYTEWAIDAVHKEFSRLLNRRAEIEQLMLDAASGRIDMPSPDTLRRWAIALGTGKKVSEIE